MSDPPEDLQTGKTPPFVVMWLETKRGVKYTMPDMLTTHVTMAHRQLDGIQDMVTVVNVSGAVLILPRRIIKSAGVGVRMFWESE